jgi:hypothetical protein
VRLAEGGHGDLPLDELGRTLGVDVCVEHRGGVLEQLLDCEVMLRSRHHGSSRAKSHSAAPAARPS